MLDFFFTAYEPEFFSRTKMKIYDQAQAECHKQNGGLLTVSASDEYAKVKEKIKGNALFIGKVNEIVF